MLKIRPEHISIFNEQMLVRFVEEMVKYLNTSFPLTADHYSEFKLRSLIHDGVAAADRYGITDAMDVQRYLEFMMRHGPDLDQTDSWARVILNDCDLGGNEKMNRLEDYELFEQDLILEKPETD